MAILTTVTMAGMAVKDAIVEVYPDTTVTYDQNLTYEEGETYSRIVTPTANKDDLSKTGMPLLLYNRSVLRRSEMGGRGPMRTYEVDESRTKLDLKSFTVTHCEFDFRFMLIDKDIENIEAFEIDFVSENGLGSIKEVKLDLSSIDLGIWPYYVKWNQPLDDLNMNINGSTYIGVGGSGTVWGWFITMTGTKPVIASINTKIFDRSGHLLDEFNTPKET